MYVMNILKQVVDLWNTKRQRYCTILNKSLIIHTYTVLRGVKVYLGPQY